MKTENMTFSEALEAMKQGEKSELDCWLYLFEKQGYCL